MLLNIANLLLREKLINYEDINSMLSEGREIGIEDFQDSLVSTGRIDGNVLAKIIKKNFNTSIENIRGVEVDQDILKLIKLNTAAKNLVLPLRISDEKLVVAMTNPTDLILIDELSFESGYNISPVTASADVLREEIVKNYKIDTKIHGDLLATGDDKESPEELLSILKESEPGHEELTLSETYTIISPENSSANINPFRSALNRHSGEQQGENDLDTSKSLPTENNRDSVAEPIQSADSTNKNDEVPAETEERTNLFASPLKDKNEAPPLDEIQNEKSAADNMDEINPFISAKSLEEQKEFEVNPFSDENEEQSEAETIQGEQTDSYKLEETPKEAHNINILLVDQSLTTQRIVSETLENEGFRITVSDNAIDAMSKINKKMPDLIVIDVSLPHMDGYQFCKIIKKNGETRNIPVVMLSGSDGIFDKMKGKIAGASEYLTKPFSPAILSEVVRKLTGV